MGTDLYTLDAEREYRVVTLDEETPKLAEELVRRHPPRAADAIHVATALVIGADLSAERSLRFYTGDRQSNAATAEGLDVIFVGA